MWSLGVHKVGGEGCGVLESIKWVVKDVESWST